MNIEPFTVNISESVLNDLRSRLIQTRWPDEVEKSGWDYGANLAYIKELVDYWINEFDWDAQQETINKFQHFIADTGDLPVHFIHEKGTGPNPFPIIITHGWPSSSLEMVKLIPFLTDPASYGGDPSDSFDIIAPSLPGYGFSGRPQKTGMNVACISDIWNRIMTQGLGYKRYGAAGGDWGATVTARMGYDFAENIAGIHVTSISGVSPYLAEGSRELSKAEIALSEERLAWTMNEGGYFHIQATKPQTLAYGLTDSPAGLAAWIVEKFRAWSDCSGVIENSFSKDELLTNVTLYWATETINSSSRLYYEGLHSPWKIGPNDRINVPSAICQFPKELSHPPREWAERTFNVQRWTEMPRGGHFAASEEPELLANDIKEFFRPLRRS